jgi:hypothetical protein
LAVVVLSPSPTRSCVPAPLSPSRPWTTRKHRRWAGDPGELMHADNVGRLALGPGDREGLAALGSGRCFH